MPSWEEMKAAAGRGFMHAYNDIGSTYQQILRGGAGLYQGNFQTPQQITAAYGQVNPEYREAERAYIAQETERGRLEGITIDDYQPTDIDWQEYGRHVDEYRAANPVREPEPQDLEPER